MRQIFTGLDVGSRRKKNEDFVLLDEDLRLGVVADGVGGHRGGDRAARIAAETVHQMLTDQSWVIEGIRKGDRSVDPEDIAKVARFALNRASQMIANEARENPDLTGMSTTCTLALELGDRALIAHVGDSRAYVVRAGQVLRVTEDHVVAMAGVGGEAGKPVKERVLSRAIGTEAQCAVDIMWVDLKPKDFIVLCSDGLSDMFVNDDELGEILEAFGSEASPEVLVDLANTRGGPDNIAVVVFDQQKEAKDGPGRVAWVDTKAQLQVLRNLKPFSSLAYFELEALRPAVRVDMYRPGTTIAPKPNEPMLAVVAKGTVEIRHEAFRYEVGPGGVLGETALTTRKDWPYEARAKDEAVILVLPIDTLTAFISEKPVASTRLMWTFLSTASERYLQISNRVRDSIAPGAPAIVDAPAMSTPPPAAEAPRSVPPPPVKAPEPKASQPAPAAKSEPPPAAKSEPPPAAKSEPPAAKSEPPAAKSEPPPAEEPSEATADAPASDPADDRVPVPRTPSIKLPPMPMPGQTEMPAFATPGSLAPAAVESSDETNDETTGSDDEEDRMTVPPPAQAASDIDDNRNTIPPKAEKTTEPPEETST